MTTLAEIRKEAMKLSEAERAELADELRKSLPPPQLDNDDWSEISRRMEEMERDPSSRISWDELRASVGR